MGFSVIDVLNVFTYFEEQLVAGFVKVSIQIR
jgi:hypothetical protein